MDERKVRDERSGWRDQDLGPWHRKHGFDYPVADPNDLDFNNRHRDWGWDCPTVDIDLPFIEYDNCFPVALFDYKLRENLAGPEPNRNGANYLALSRLRTTKGQLPFYVTHYTKNPWTFRPIWMNTQAKQLSPKKQFLTESEFVTWLYWLRGRTVSTTITNQLDNQASWEFPLPFSVFTHRKLRKKRTNKSSTPTLFDQTPVLQCALWEVPV